MIKARPTFALLVTACAAIFIVSACVSPQIRESELTRKSGARVSGLSFNADVSREQYIILGPVSGEGLVERKLMGKKPKEKSLLSYLVPESYYILEYDHSLGTWTDETHLDADAISDRRMDAAETDLMGRMETIAARIALYQALASLPEADAILAPRYEFTYTTDDRVLGKDQVVGRNISSVRARMVGKAIRIKTEEELYSTYREFPGLAGRPADAE